MKNPIEAVRQIKRCLEALSENPTNEQSTIVLTAISKILEDVDWTWAPPVRGPAVVELLKSVAQPQAKTP